MARYTKPAFGIEQHLQQWQDRGLSIPELPRARHYLERISYYRLSAYAIPLYRSGADHHFRDGATFDQILALYVFDRELRLLVLDAIERIEVALRAQLSNHMATQERGGPFWYLEIRHFKTEFAHDRLLTDLERQMAEEKQRLLREEQHVDRRNNLTPEQKTRIKARLRKENFLRHYLTEYDTPKLPPSWMVMEMLTWGQLSRLYAGLRQTSDQKSVARSMGTHAELLESWLKTLNTVRNFCAHHGRLWNRELGTALSLPKSSSIRWLQKPVRLDAGGRHIDFKKRLYPVLAALQSLLYNISPGSRWACRLQVLLNKYPEVGKAAMGMPERWHEDPFWADALQRETEK